MGTRIEAGQAVPLVWGDIRSQSLGGQCPSTLREAAAHGFRVGSDPRPIHGCVPGSGTSRATSSVEFGARGAGRNEGENHMPNGLGQIEQFIVSLLDNGSRLQGPAVARYVDRVRRAHPEE